MKIVGFVVHPILEKGVDFGLELLLSSIPGGTFAKKLVETILESIK